eukprot:CAMPEP_0197679290 /NCGR_PEP_ID=MMETSP1338-20131121/91448_1 /TAXON_ID=43686 ORGANISM="Pelagodinium beii, Strain RCC1491" /NCGR_SAMPLE_ID=MMETSP1338 /ASSEMBLY_ACC=CAM_ASM_000754 /LENGTH=473 /DNA_ID=CAMNT_0043260331 /DNA_START=21 /DNA_END=1438 /DNA_ORIENTATION=-
MQMSQSLGSLHAISMDTLGVLREGGGTGVDTLRSMEMSLLMMARMQQVPVKSDLDKLKEDYNGNDLGNQSNVTGTNFSLQNDSHTGELNTTINQIETFLMAVFNVTRQMKEVIIDKLNYSNYSIINRSKEVLLCRDQLIRNFTEIYDMRYKMGLMKGEMKQCVDLGGKIVDPDEEAEGTPKDLAKKQALERGAEEHSISCAGEAAFNEVKKSNLFAVVEKAEIAGLAAKAKAKTKRLDNQHVAQTTLQVVAAYTDNQQLGHSFGAAAAAAAFYEFECKKPLEDAATTAAFAAFSAVKGWHVPGPILACKDASSKKEFSLIEMVSIAGSAAFSVCSTAVLKFDLAVGVDCRDMAGRISDKVGQGNGMSFVDANVTATQVLRYTATYETVPPSTTMLVILDNVRIATRTRLLSFLLPTPSAEQAAQAIDSHRGFKSLTPKVDDSATIVRVATAASAAEKEEGLPPLHQDVTAGKV